MQTTTSSSYCQPKSQEDKHIVFQQQENSTLKPSSLYILGTKVDDVSLEDALDKVEGFLSTPPIPPFVRGGGFITTPNPEICLYATRDEHYRRDILDKAFLAIPDGFGLKIAAWIFGERLRNRVTGVDFTHALMKLAAQKGWRVFLYGGEGDVAERCGKVLMERYKGLLVVGAKSDEIFNFQFSIFNKFSNNQFLKSKQQSISPPYEGGGQGEVVESINQNKPDILLVALGAPRQEYWIAENLGKIPSVRLAVGVGGTFDFIVGRVKRAPFVIRKFGLEWVWRLIMQPWRLPRIYRATLKFLVTVLQWRLRMWFVYRKNVVGLIVRGGEDFKSVGSSFKLEPTDGGLARRSLGVGGCSLAGKMSPSQGEDRRFKSGHPLQTPLHPYEGGIQGGKEGMGEVLLVEREDESAHWQLPQGGVDEKETPKQAIMREMKEELGTDKLKIIHHASHFHKYRWPKVDQLRRGYRGQSQDLFIMEFKGGDLDIQLDKSEHINFKWVSIQEAVVTAHPVRREQVEKAIAVLSNLK